MGPFHFFFLSFFFWFKDRKTNVSGTMAGLLDFKSLQEIIQSLWEDEAKLKRFRQGQMKRGHSF